MACVVHTTDSVDGKLPCERRLFLVALCVTLPALVAAAPAGPQQDVLNYLDRNLDWYRRVTALSPAPTSSGDLLFRDAARQEARRALRLAFRYARAQAALLEQTTPAVADAQGRSRNLSEAAATAAQRAQQLQAEIDLLQRQIRGASATSRPALEAQRELLAAELDFATARRDIIQNASGFLSEVQNGGAGGLSAQIDELERSVPEIGQGEGGVSATQPAPAASAGGSSAVQQQIFRPESAGIVGLISELFNLSAGMGDLKRAADQAGALRQQNRKLLSPLRSELLDDIHRSDALAATTQGTDDPQALAKRRQQLESLSARFRQVSDVALPLGEQGALLDAGRANLLQWRDSLDRAFDRGVRNLLIRTAGILITLLIILGIATLWRRATFRYVTDPRRRLQFLLVRRIVISCIIVIVLIAGIVTEFGSLATFAGLITAGIAVALQSVILSGAAYFFFIGRYGVRVGDRITISGITGDVLETGLFRLYLLELAGSAADLNPTGRIVIFSNSVLFQSAPLYKQLPGTNFAWHELALTLSPQTDYRLAEKRLMDAAQSVFADYRELLERQYAAARGSIHLSIPPPRPEGRLRFVDAGLEFVLRYPVDIRRASEIDDRITRRLLESIDEEPRLKLVATSPPKIQAAGGTA